MSLASMLNKRASALKRFSGIVKRSSLWAFNRAAKSGLSHADRFVRSGYAIKKEDLNKVVDFVKAADADNIVAVIKISGAGIPLSAFNPKQKSRGVTAKIRKGGKSQMFQSAFLAEMKFSKPGVFKRENKNRDSVFALYGPQVSQLLTSDESIAVMESQTTNEFAKNFFHDVDRRLK